MTQFLPPNLLALFAPRDPIPFLPPIEKHKNHRKLPYTGVAQFLERFENPEDTPTAARIETREERKTRKRKEKQEQASYKLEQDLALWNPKKNTNATSNPHNTLFVARLNYDTSEQKLKREMEYYGPVKKIVMVKDIYTNKSRGYAFIEFEQERDMHGQLHLYYTLTSQDVNNRKIDGYRILTDVERGRTRPEWRPRRLGKGLGRTRDGPSDRDRRKDPHAPTYLIREKEMDRKRKSRSRSKERRKRSRSKERARGGNNRRYREEKRSRPEPQWSRHGPPPMPSGPGMYGAPPPPQHYGGGYY
ncbi:U1 small nuclear ribonucleoprotein 70 kDa [Cichlidogyrus casuarinus]|uniref:U1 small nuclear ribonucleoprotein 70 kDa n=1 Tax=Cichlidogyrus casuarinus TaxID=1844966 RepID=A0ABD2PVK4_9PLAT